MEAALKVKDLCKTYITNKRQNNVLKNVNFTINKGEMIAIMGPSGSGKSTLLYSISGMDKPTAGEVYLADKKISDLSERELAEIRLNEMGFIFQQMHMLKNLSVMDNILLPAYQSENKSRSRAEIDEYCRVLMRKLGILEIANNDITEVSGGQLQRACICRSMINKPEILTVVSQKASAKIGARVTVKLVDGKSAPAKNQQMEQLLRFGREHSDYINIKE